MRTNQNEVAGTTVEAMPVFSMTPTGMVNEITRQIQDFNGRDAADGIAPREVAENIVARCMAHDGPEIA